MEKEVYSDQVIPMRVPPQTKMTRFRRTYTKYSVDPTWDAAKLTLNWEYILNEIKKKISKNNEDTTSTSGNHGVDSNIHYPIPTQLDGPNISHVPDSVNANYLDFLNEQST